MMTKKNLLLLAALLSANLVFSQKITLAVKAGVSESRVAVLENTLSVEDQTPPGQNGYVGGPILGLETRLVLGEKAQLLCGLQYVHKGQLSVLPLPDDRQEEAITHLHYLSLPLALDYRVFKGLSIQGGVETAYLLSAHTNTATQSFNPEKTIDLYKNFDLSTLVGLEYSFGPHFFMNARFLHGLSSISDIEITNDQGDPLPYHFYNRNFQFSAGYRF